MMTMRQAVIGAMVMMSFTGLSGQRAGASSAIVAVSATVRPACPTAVDRLAGGTYAVSSTPEAVWVHAAAGGATAPANPGRLRSPAATCRVPLRQEVTLDATRHGLVVTVAY